MDQRPEKKMKTNFKVLSVFSGAGGLDFGFYKSGFEIVFANDIYADAVETYKLNIGTHIVCDDIKNIYRDFLKLEKWIQKIKEVK